MYNFNDGKYKEGNAQEVKAARYICEQNPTRFRIDREHFQDGSIVFERLVDTRTFEEVMEWSIVEKNGMSLV